MRATVTAPHYERDREPLPPNNEVEPHWYDDIEATNVIQTTCPECGAVNRVGTSVEALTKARDWAYQRGAEGVLPEPEPREARLAAGLRHLGWSEARISDLADGRVMPDGTSGDVAPDYDCRWTSPEGWPCRASESEHDGAWAFGHHFQGAS